MAKVRIATEVLGSCCGCHVSLLDCNETILDVLELADIVYSPVLADIKEVPKDVKVGLIAGCVRNAENRHRAEKMRKNCDIIVALGACACFGGIIGLGNMTPNKEFLEKIYFEMPSNVNEKKILPKDVPPLEPRVYALDQVVKVDVKIPGCPPPASMIVEALLHLLTGSPFSLSKKNVCDTCPREISGDPIKELHWAYEGKPDPDKCLLEQGYLCMGPATRAGCGEEAVCPSVGVGCRGCFGPAENVMEQGAKMLSAFSSSLELTDETPEGIKEFEKIMKNSRIHDAIGDPIGSFYRFSLASSILPKRVNDKSKPKETESEEVEK